MIFRQSIRFRWVGIFFVVLRAKVADPDYSRVDMNFYTPSGGLKGLPGRKVAEYYDLDTI